MGPPEEFESSNDNPSDSMLRIIESSWLTKAIHTVVRLRIPDLVRDGPKRSEELAAAAGAHPGALHRILRALAAEGIFAVDDMDRFSLTPLGATLRTDVPGSLHAWALLMLDQVHQEAWSELIHSALTGESAFQHRFGMDLWQYCSEHPEHARLFGSAMSSFTMTYIEQLLGTYSFSRFDTIVDVGGGDGSLLIGILRMNPEMRGIVFEVPDVAARARQRIEEAGLTDRCTAASGDALVEVPPGGDAYVLSRVLHDWNDDDARRILTSCRNVLPPDGRLLVVERAVPDRLSEIASTRSFIFWDICMTDLNMMVMTGGRERTVADYRDLFESVGLDLVRVVGTHTAMNVIEAQMSRVE